MSISTNFDKTVDTQRLGNVGNSLKEAWATNLSDLSCAIHSESPEHNQTLDGASYKMFKMWCAIGTDILTGDKVIDGTDEYHVRSVSNKNYGSSDIQHLVVMLSLGE